MQPRGLHRTASSNMPRSPLVHSPYLSKGKSFAGDWVWEDHRRRVYKGTAGGEAVCFSGCDDDQTSADTSSLARNANTGALTFAFIQAIEEAIGSGRQATYGGIMDSINRTLHPSRFGGGGLSSRFRMGFSQEPQISAAAPFNMDTAFTL